MKPSIVNSGMERVILEHEMRYISNLGIEQPFFLIEQGSGLFELVDFEFEVFVALLDLS
jgi:hypothetical protein